MALNNQRSSNMWNPAMTPHHTSTFSSPGYDPYAEVEYNPYARVEYDHHPRTEYDPHPRVERDPHPRVERDPRPRVERAPRPQGERASRPRVERDLSPQVEHDPHARGPYPSPYHVSETANAMEAFAAINRALGARNMRQSVAGTSRQATQAPKPPEPKAHAMSQTLKKAQPRMDATMYPSAMTTHVPFEQGGANPRLSTASTPAYTRISDARSSNEPGRHSAYPRGPTGGGQVSTARPALRVITPGSPQWPTDRMRRRQERTFQDMGYHTAPPKDRSSCIVM